MKRPGWLGGKDEDEEPVGGKKAGKRSDRTPLDDPKPGADGREGRGGERSSEARRRLADRVGRAGDAEGESQPKHRGVKREQKKPEGGGPAREPGRRSDDDEGSRPAASRPEKERTTSRPAGEKREKLNRPRRQPASEADRSKQPRRAGGDTERGERDEDRKRDPRTPRSGESARRKRRDPSHGADDERRKGGAGAGAGAGDSKRGRSKGPAAGKRLGAGAASVAGALKRGTVETRQWAKTNAPRAGRMLLAGLGAVFALFFEVLGFLLNLGIAAWRIVARPVLAVGRALDRIARAASRRLTPARALAIVVAGAAILLALSQYADYRSISIGNGAYADVQSLAPAPETGREQTGDPHSYVFVPVAIACLLLLAVATIGGRWRACRLIALAGVAAIVVAILVDRPAGLDPGDAALAFEGVKAKLIGGFYAQIAAGVLLVGASSLLARELRLAGAVKREPASRTTRAATANAKLRRAPGTGGTARA